MREKDDVRGGGLDGFLGLLLASTISRGLRQADSDEVCFCWAVDIECLR